MSIPTTMQAVYVRRAGGVDAMTLGPLPVPRPGPTDALVHFGASAVNHVDLLVRSGTYRTPMPMPFVVGRDLVGTVVEAGPGVVGHAVGDRVWSNSLGHAGRQGSYSEYVVVPGDRLYPLPEAVRPTEAAAVLHPGATAHLALFREAGLRMGETILVGGAAGGVGSAVVQLAHAAGARVIATASPTDAEWCRSCGADVALDYHSPDLPDLVREAAPEGIDVWCDTSGRQDFGWSLPLMRLGGRVIVIAALEATATLPVPAFYRRDLSLRGFVISNASVADLAAAAWTINQLLGEGRLRARIGATFQLAEAADAHRALESGATHGRIVVVP